MTIQQLTLDQIEKDYQLKLAKLAPMQQQFVQEYLIDLNATQAAKRAGYSEKSAETIGSRLYRRQKIRTCIDLALEARSRRTGTTSDRVIEELWKNYERCMQETPALDRQGRETGVYKYEPAAANRALELIGQHLGMFGKQEGGKHLHLHEGDTLVNYPPVPKTIEEWVDQMHKTGYLPEADVVVVESEAKDADI